MDRNPITMINRRRMLAEALNACTAQEVRNEVAAHLIRSYPAPGHAQHVAAEIMERTAGHVSEKPALYAPQKSMPLAARVVGLLLATVLAAAVIAAVGFVAISAYRYAAKVPTEALTYQGEFRHG